MNATTSNRSKNDTFSMVYQQIACTYSAHYHELPEKDIRIIESFIPDVNKYSPHWADMVKDSGLGYKSVREFLKCYISLGIRYPFTYLKAFYYHNIGYFYPFDKENAFVQNPSSRWGGYMETELRDIKKQDEAIAFEKKSFLPQVERLYERLVTNNYYQKFFILFISMSLGTFFWIQIYLIYLSIVTNCTGYILNGSNLVGSLLCLVFSPMVIVRYSLPTIVTTPVLFYNIFLCINDNKNMERSQ